MKGLGLRRRFAGFIAVIILAFASIGIVQALFLQEQRDSWHSLRDQALAREHLLAAIRSQMGYGSLIHNFKNYVLRGQDDYYRKITENHSAVTLGIKQYRQLSGLTAAEDQALDEIQQVADQYLSSAIAVRDLLARGADSGSIDKSVKISDAPAIQGFAYLQVRYSELLAIYTGEFESRADTGLSRVLILMLGPLAVILLGAFMFYRYLAGGVTVLRAVPQNMPGRAMSPVAEPDAMTGRRSQNHSCNPLLSEEAAAAVERNKAVIAELDHKAMH